MSERWAEADKAKKIIIAIIAAVAMLYVMLLIFTFSAQDVVQTTKTSDSVAGAVVPSEKVPSASSGETVSSVIIAFGLNIRKLGHVLVYATLGVCTSFFTMSLMQFTRKNRLCKTLCAFALAMVICFLYACSDEFHQTFVYGRNGCIADVGKDSIGYSIACAVFAVSYMLPYFVKKLLLLRT